MFRDSVIAAIRTGVASLVGIVIAWLVNIGVEVPDDFQSSLAAVVVAAIVIGYNLLVGLLERRVNPFFGVLLGVPKAPAYGAVGTQTTPPADPLIGDPPADRGEAGNTSLVTAGIVVAVVGLIVLVATALNALGNVLIVGGVVLALVGLFLYLSRGRGARL